jgi:hypothetical protein
MVDAWTAVALLNGILLVLLFRRYAKWKLPNAIHAALFVHLSWGELHHTEFVLSLWRFIGYTDPGETRQKATIDLFAAAVGSVVGTYIDEYTTS